tara:strand:- start:409 stop:1224 length:816 start_codon:yes stop_codon:yes gene_type:complete
MNYNKKRKIIISVIVFILFYGYVLYYFYTNQNSILYLPQARVESEISNFAVEEDYTEFKYKTKDGLDLTALYKEPKEGMPIIVFFNGNAAKIERANSSIEKFIELGYGGVINIYRGYGANPGKPSKQNFFTDGQTLINIIKEKFPENEIIIFGYSIGSGTATYLASKNNIKALIIESGFSAASDVAKDKYPFLPVDALMQDKFLNKDYIKDVKSPIIMIHGDEDRVVDLKFAKKLADVSKNITLKVYEAGDHRNLKCLDAYDDVIEWLDKI